jgi:hypothetical protein
MNRIQGVKRRNGQLALVLGDARGIIFIDHLEKGQTFNSEYYMALLERLNDEIMNKTAHCMNKAINCFSIHRILQIWPQ